METTYTFCSIMEGDKPVKCSSFEEAFTAMFKWVTDKINSNDLALQVLETAIWIEINGLPLYFYDARDRAIKMGILKDGKLV